MKKNTKKLKSQIGILLIILLIGSALGYAFFGKTGPNTISNETTSSLGDAKGVSCGVASKSTASSAGGCSMMSGNKTQPASSQQAAPIDAQSQMIPMNYDESGLTPTDINVEIGKSYTLIVNVKVDVVGCMSTISIPGLDENVQNVRKGNTLTFHIKPTTAGVYDFDCAMGVSHGAKIIVK